jgi:hypothetical protein
MTPKQQSDYDEGFNQGFQPYWIMYCLYNNLEINSVPETMGDFIIWIIAKTRQFEIDKKTEYVGNYKQFLEWLKEEL